MYLTRYAQPLSKNLFRSPRHLHLANKLAGQGVSLRSPLQAFAHITEQDNKVELSVDVPGIQAKDLDIKVDDNRVLTISGNRVIQNAGSSSSWKFSRQFALDSVVDTSSLKANLSEGVLTISAPKMEKPGPLQIPVTQDSHPGDHLTSIANPDDAVVKAMSESESVVIKGEESDDAELIVAPDTSEKSR